MIIRDGWRRLETKGSFIYNPKSIHNYDPIYSIDMQWRDESSGWASEDKWNLDRKEVLRLMEDIRLWLKANPE
jgi:hypothetical protein